jgi:DNA polymerase-3 subunit beta
MDSEVLASMVQRTSFAVSRDEMRYFLNGVYLSLRNDDEEDASGCLVTMAATDGARLAVASSKAEGRSEEDGGVIIPIKAAAQLRSMLPRSDVVRIGIHDSRIAFDMGDIILVSRLIEGEYPDYERVIPERNSIKLTVDTQRLLSAAKRVATMADPKMPGVKMEAIGDILKMSSSTPEFGEAYEEMPIKKEGDDIGIGLNARYLMDALKAIQSEKVILGIDMPLKPVLVKPAVDNDCLHVLMPMRL